MRASLLVLFISVILLIQCKSAVGIDPSFVSREGEQVFIVDRLGERWDVTQAAGIGFEPGKFQYGIGRNAFTTLDDSYLSDDTSGIPERARVIGIAEGSDAKAYSVAKLSGHEVSNSELNGKTLTIRPSGWTYENTFVLMDVETGSLWYPDRNGLKAIQGQHLGQYLPEITSHDTSWGRWKTDNPGSKLLR